MRMRYIEIPVESQRGGIANQGEGLLGLTREVIDALGQEFPQGTVMLVPDSSTNQQRGSIGIRYQFKEPQELDPQIIVDYQGALEEHCTQPLEISTRRPYSIQQSSGKEPIWYLKKEDIREQREKNHQNTLIAAVELPYGVTAQSNGQTKFIPRRKHATGNCNYEIHQWQTPRQANSNLCLIEQNMKDARTFARKASQRIGGGVVVEYQYEKQTNEHDILLYQARKIS